MYEESLQAYYKGWNQLKQFENLQEMYFNKNCENLHLMKIETWWMLNRFKKLHLQGNQEFLLYQRQ